MNGYNYIFICYNEKFQYMIMRLGGNCRENYKNI